MSAPDRVWHIGNGLIRWLRGTSKLDALREEAVRRGWTRREFGQHGCEWTYDNGRRDPVRRQLGKWYWAAGPNKTYQLAQTEEEALENALRLYGRVQP